MKRLDAVERKQTRQQLKLDELIVHSFPERPPGNFSEAVCMYEKPPGVFTPHVHFEDDAKDDAVYPAEVFDAEDDAVSPANDNFTTDFASKDFDFPNEEDSTHNDTAIDRNTVNMMIDIAQKISRRVCESATEAIFNSMVSKLGAKLGAVMEEKTTEFQARTNMRILQKEKELEKLRCAHEDTRIQVSFTKDSVTLLSRNIAELHKFLYDKGMTDIVDLNGFDSSSVATSDNDAPSDSSSHYSGVFNDEPVAFDNDPASDCDDVPVPKGKSKGKKGKRPPCAQLLFAHERAPHYKSMMPHADPSDLATRIVKEWDSLDKTKKDVFFAKASKLQAEYSGKSRGSSSDSRG